MKPSSSVSWSAKGLFFVIAVLAVAVFTSKPAMASGTTLINDTSTTVVIATTSAEAAFFGYGFGPLCHTVADASDLASISYTAGLDHPVSASIDFSGNIRAEFLVADVGTAASGSFEIGRHGLDDCFGDFNDTFTTTQENITDNARPFVTINQKGGQADPTAIDPVKFTARFTEKIASATFDQNDIIQNGTMGNINISWQVHNIASNSKDFEIWALINDPASGTLEPIIAFDVVNDLNGNGNWASTPADNVVTYDSVVVALDSISVQNDPIAPTASVDFVVTGSGFETFVHSGTFDADDTDRQNIIYTSGIFTKYPVSAHIDDTSHITLVFNIVEDIVDTSILSGTNVLFCGTDSVNPSCTAGGTVKNGASVANLESSLGTVDMTDIAVPKIQVVYSGTASPVGTGDTVNIIIRFTEKVHIDTSGGIPALLLNATGTGPTASASYPTVTDTNNPVFIYTVRAGHSASPLAYGDDNDLHLNSGTIDDTATIPNIADLTLPGTGTPKSLELNSIGSGPITVETSAPSVNGIGVSPSVIAIANAGLDQFAVTITFSEAMNTGSTPAIDFTPDIEGSGTLTPSLTQTWDFGNTVFTQYYDVADVSEAQSGVDVSVQGAQDVAGNVMSPNPTTEADVFNLDMVAPPAPTADHTAGTYTASFNLALSAGLGESIHYTTDGSAPNCGSTTYASAFSVSTTQTINAVACDAALNVSSVAPFAYTISIHSGSSGSRIHAPTLPSTTPSHTNGTLVRYAGDPKVYLLEGGTKRWVQTADDFIALGFNWSNILTIPSTETYPDGPALQANRGLITKIFVHFLARGSAGAEVRALQQKLKDLGFFPANLTPTGFFGPATMNAVKAFQKAHGIPQAGYVGVATRAALNK